MALAVSPFIYRVIIALGTFLPLPTKIFSATTEKNQQSRVKQKLENRVLVIWRQ
jgi:hypothetical protein